MGLFKRYSFCYCKDVDRDWWKAVKKTNLRINHILKQIIPFIKYKITGRTSMFENFFIGNTKKQDREDMRNYLDKMYNCIGANLYDYTIDHFIETKKLVEKIAELEKQIANLTKTG